MSVCVGPGGVTAREQVRLGDGVDVDVDDGIEAVLEVSMFSNEVSS